MTQQQTHADQFRSLHRAGTPLVLVNAWDAASARIVEAAGASAVATTSAGVAWSLGTPDGDALGRDLAVGLVARVAAAVSVPVTADIESGFGATPAEVGQTVRAIIEAGAVGVNIEDTWRSEGAALRTVADQCARLAAARAAAHESGVPLFINARVDVFLRSAGGVEDALARASAYLDAGADGVFVPGVTDADTNLRSGRGTHGAAEHPGRPGCAIGAGTRPAGGSPGEPRFGGRRGRLRRRPARCR